MNIDTTKHDPTQIFLTFMVLVGDVDKTAAALDLEPTFVRKLASELGWTEKVQRISILAKSGKPGDWERAQNRALCFVQAHQLRRVLDNQLMMLAEKAVDEVMKVTDRNGETRFSSRVLTDLASAMQKVHEMSYSALGDSVKERTTDKLPDDVVTQGGIHAAMIASLNRRALPAEAPANTLADEAGTVIDALKSANPPEAAKILDSPQPSTG